MLITILSIITGALIGITPLLLFFREYRAAVVSLGIAATISATVEIYIRL